MDLNNTPNPPGTDKPPVNYLPFENLAELEKKVEKLHFIKTLNNNLITATLERYNIQYSILVDGALIIEANAIPESCRQIVTVCLRQMASNLKQCYQDLGIVCTNKQEGEPGALYEGLIQLLNNRNN